jgi:hypothetical protein
VTDRNPNLVNVEGTNETGYQYTFKSGLVCNKPPYYTRYIKTGGAIAIKSLFEARTDFESDWKKTSQASPRLEELESVFFDVCYEHGNGLIDELIYKERSNKYDRIRQKLLEQGLSEDPETDIRFEARLADTRFYQLTGKRRVEFIWKFQPTLTDPNKAVHVFLGLTVLHDEDKVPDINVEGKPCSEVMSCLSFQIWDEQADPIIIRGGTSSNDISWRTDLPEKVQTIRIVWEFIQLEADLGNKCAVIKENPSGGLPFVDVVSPSGKKLGSGCYSSRGVKIQKVSF